MRFLRRWWTRIWNFATGRRDDQRLREEMEQHIALQTEENLRAGMSAAEAIEAVPTRAAAANNAH